MRCRKAEATPFATDRVALTKVESPFYSIDRIMSIPAAGAARDPPPLLDVMGAKFAALLDLQKRFFLA